MIVDREHVWAIVSFIVIAVIATVLLYMGASGALPKGFGLFDMSKLGTRLTVVVILLAVAAILYTWHQGATRRAVK
jgi:uncharacterized membrane protein